MARKKRTGENDINRLLAVAQVPVNAVYKQSPVALDILRRLDEANKKQLEQSVALAAGRSASGKRSAPPLANRGGKSGDDFIKLVLEDGKIKEVLKRSRNPDDCAVIDWINFTVGIETFDGDSCAISDDTKVHDDEKSPPISPDDYAICISKRLFSIFGYGISHPLNYGLHFYDQSFALPDSWGVVSLGGQRDTVLISISGEGLAAAAEGFEVRLKAFLDIASRPRITRLDLAHDDFTGARYTVDKANQDHTDGLYNCGGRNPSCEHRGDWKNPSGKGRTFNVGNRKNGKFARIYEKGKQLGDPNSDWCRIEVEFKSIDRVIPFDALLHPGQYLSAAYPALSWLSERQERILTTKKQTEASVDKAFKWLRHQCGTYVHSLVQLFGVETFLAEVSRNDKLPKFMNLPHFGLAAAPLHLVRKSNLTANLYAASAAW